MRTDIVIIVHLLTTGGGKYRFNPNLYEDGKVCLSLLGTWFGPGSVSGESLLRQVLISTQSLVLVKDPYFNERARIPEALVCGTPQGTAASNTYNTAARQYTNDVGLHLDFHEAILCPYPESDLATERHFC